MSITNADPYAIPADLRANRAQRRKRQLFYLPAMAALAAVSVTPLLSGCGVDFCKGEPPSIFCPDNPRTSGPGSGGSPGGQVSCMLGGGSLWECNVVNGPNTVPVPVDGHFHPGMCGSFYCASSLADAQNQSGAAGDPGLSCIQYGLFTNPVPPWTSCITACNPCDDGQGNTLQNVGEPCGGFNICCAGLTCVGAMASTMGTCQGTAQCQKKPPALVPLTTTRLRAIAAANNIGAGQTGIQQSRTIGLAFENWVLTTMGQIPRNTALLPSPLRQQKNMVTGGLPGSVIPEYIGSLNDWFPAQGWSSFTKSMFFEVKAVTGVITQSTSKWQILGLIDVASQSPAGKTPQPNHVPPALVFTTTGNTNIGLDVLQVATMLGVAIWQQLVMEDTNTNVNNPDLYIDQALPANQDVYNGAVPLPMHPAWPHSPLTSPTSPPMPVPGDPDPPEVD